MPRTSSNVHGPGATPRESFSRRAFLKLTTAATLPLILPRPAAAMRSLKRAVRIGLLADLHHDIMHDGFNRMESFVQAMAARHVDAVVQLGDFAYPNKKNHGVVDLFNRSHEQALHVIGNHDTDAGHTQQQCLDMWGMPGRYYVRTIAGLHLLILDGNDRGSPTHQGGYPSYVGPEQQEWLKDRLASPAGPVLVLSHQPLAGAWAVDNAEEMQTLLGAAADKVLLAINGHSHIDDLLRVQGVPYLHVNSASYQWVGSAHQHESYSREVHASHPWISYTCPYRTALFATLTVDPANLTIRLEGRQSQWVGRSPAELGKDLHPDLINGEEIAPRIRDREIQRVAT